MGTRADFYVGCGVDAEWIGSIALDGYRDGIDPQILNCQSEAAFRHAVDAFISDRDDGTKPSDGWPWPWDTSATTDCSYWFFGGFCWDEQGGKYARCDKRAPLDKDGEFTKAHARLKDVTFPNMAALKNVTMGRRSGILLIRA